MVQLTPLQIQTNGLRTDYANYTVLNWNAEEGPSSAFQCTTN